MTTERLQLVKKMTTEVDVYQTIAISKKKKKELIALDLSKEQKLDADTKAIQQIILTGNLNKGRGARMYFSIEEAKETVPDLSKGTVKVL